MRRTWQIPRFAFGSIQIDGVTYEYDVVIEGGQVRKKKKASKKLKADFGHTPASRGHAVGSSSEPAHTAPCRG